ncbi:MAG: hypothetical protein IJT14_01060 [Rickettsiales bacterium]|nr:hypothetical protein [Rickettsiales bacterium]
MSNTTTPRTTTQPQQQQTTDEQNKQKLKKARKALDTVKTGNKYLYQHNQMRKKLKRWFKACSKKNFTEAGQGELCYNIIGDDILLGKKKDCHHNDGDHGACKHIDTPYLQFSKQKNDILIVYSTVTDNVPAELEKSVETMKYTEFYDNYYNTVIGGNRVTDIWDAFMSWTQTIRQKMSGNEGKAESIGGHAANIASRIFSPVIAPVIGVCAGAKALKGKLMYTQKEQENLIGALRQSYQLKDWRSDEMKQPTNDRQIKAANQTYENDLKKFNNKLTELSDKLFTGDIMQIRANAQIINNYQEWCQKVLNNDYLAIDSLMKANRQQQQIQQ